MRSLARVALHATFQKLPSSLRASSLRASSLHASSLRASSLRASSLHVSSFHPTCVRVGLHARARVGGSCWREQAYLPNTTLMRFTVISAAAHTHTHANARTHAQWLEQGTGPDMCPRDMAVVLDACPCAKRRILSTEGCISWNVRSSSSHNKVSTQQLPNTIPNKVDWRGSEPPHRLWRRGFPVITTGGYRLSTISKRLCSCNAPLKARPLSELSQYSTCRCLNSRL